VLGTLSVAATPGLPAFKEAFEQGGMEQVRGRVEGAQEDEPCADAKRAWRCGEAAVSYLYNDVG
jgi:hypothetical protein